MTQPPTAVLGETDQEALQSPSEQQEARMAWQAREASQLKRALAMFSICSSTVWCHEAVDASLLIKRLTILQASTFMQSQALLCLPFGIANKSN